MAPTTPAIAFEMPPEEDEVEEAVEEELDGDTAVGAQIPVVLPHWKPALHVSGTSYSGVRRGGRAYTR